MGSVVAALTASAPWLVTLSQYKAWTFLVAGGVLAAAGWLIYRPGRSCPMDPASAKACARADRWSRRAWWGACLVWFFAAFMAYAWLPLQLAVA